ncbi:MAG: endopeptidase La [Lachnospiraceae bacterium]|nr:endopeptidase La [Lachnospiraceae bacterium]
MIVVPVYNKMILPYSRIYFRTDEFKSLSGRVAIGEKVVMLVKKEDIPKEEYKEDSFYPLAVTGNISSISAEGYVEVMAGERVYIDDVSINQDYSIELSIRRNPVTIDISEELRSKKLEQIRKEMNEYVSNYSWGQSAKAFISQFNSLEETVCAMSIWMTISNEEQYSLLEIDSLKKRTEEIERMLYEYIEVAKVSSDASFAQQEEYQNMYKESAIKKQMEYLQKELDELHPEKVTDVRKFEMKIDNAGMNETAEAEARKVLNRLKQEGSHSSETGMLYDYLDFVTSLSWKSEDPKNIDLDFASKILDEDHFGLKKVKKRIIQQIAVMNLKKKQSGSILLFVGAPGTGKTSIGKSIARALGREYSRVSLGGARDEADIRGHRRTYIGAMPGRIMDGIQKSGVSNPVMVLDEVDKIGASYHGDPASALLEVLDPEQNHTFTDHYMNVPYDLSDVFFICTANTTDTIPGPLLDRMEVIHFEGYTPLEKLSIAKEHLLPKAMEKMGIPEGKISISDDMINKIISEYTREAGVRGLRKRMDTLCRGAAVEIAKEPENVFEVTEDRLRDELDMRPVHREKVPEKQKSGVVTGLAWTSVGGEILYIETVFTKGKGNIIITGQLGDVMKESAQIAVSLVKTMFPDKADVFEKNDIHIHVPEGAVPKDGPSAGITLTTAIASLVTDKAVDPHFAMTGEVSLRGVVTPIGGLPEKLMAAQRAGVKNAFIPKENEDDLRDVAKEVLDQINVIPVSNVEEVLKRVGITTDDMQRDTDAA